MKISAVFETTKLSKVNICIGNNSKSTGTTEMERTW